MANGTRDNDNVSPKRGNNKHAATVLNIDCARRQKNAWVKAAQKSGVRLDEWVVQQLDQAAMRVGAFE